MQAADKIRALIAAAEKDRAWHREFGTSSEDHMLEALACSVRLVALRDALACLTPDAPQPEGNRRRWIAGKLT